MYEDVRVKPRVWSNLPSTSKRLVGRRLGAFFWVSGARGFTSGLVNVLAAPSLEMLRRLESADYEGAMDVWAQVKPFEDLRARRDNANNVSAVKEAMAQLGRCTREVRPPISELPASERAEVSSILATWGLV